MAKRKFAVVKLRKVADSMVVSIPKDVLENSHLEEGDKVFIWSSDTRYKQLSIIHIGCWNMNTVRLRAEMTQEELDELKPY